MPITPTTDPRETQDRGTSRVEGFDRLVMESNRLRNPTPPINAPFFCPLQDDQAVIRIAVFVGHVVRTFNGRRAEKYRFIIQYFNPHNPLAPWSPNHTWDVSKTVFLAVADIIINHSDYMIYMKRTGTGLQTRYSIETVTGRIENYPFRLGQLQPQQPYGTTSIRTYPAEALTRHILGADVPAAGTARGTGGFYASTSSRGRTNTELEDEYFNRQE